MSVHYQVILAYDGTKFSGFQRQARARTVQGVVEDALRCIGWTGRSLLAAGRTDTGVHASGQVISFDLDWRHGLDDLQSALNGNLPQDVAAWRVSQVRQDFHPRFDALFRRYRYSLICQPVRDPLRERYAWRLWPAVDMAILQEAASFFTGTHDFAAFGTPPRAGSSTLRNVIEAVWLQEQDRLVFDVTANAFLYHMVRRMVFFQVVIGQKKAAVSDLQRSLQEGRLTFQDGAILPQGIAPAQGLVLVEVVYPPEVEMNSEV